MKNYDNSKIPGLFMLMEERNIESKTIQEYLKVSSGNISNWKVGRSSPTSSVLKRLSEFFDVPVEFFANPYSSAQPPEQKESVPTQKDEDAEMNAYIISLFGRMTDEEKQGALRKLEEIVLRRPKSVK